MTRDEIAAEIAADYNLSKAVAKDVVKDVFSIVAESLRFVGDKVDIPGFGKWTITQANERNGVNPKTGAKIVIAAHSKVGFKASKGLKDGLE